MENSELEFLCPGCARRIVNRKIKVCLYCGATLPDSAIFSSEEIAALDAKQRRQREDSLRFNPADRSQSDLGNGLDSAWELGGFSGDSGGGNGGDGGGD